MLTLCREMVLKISESLSDREKIYLSMTSLSMNQLKHKFVYVEKIIVDRIINLSYFNNFECVELSDTTYRYPKYAKYIHFYADTNIIPTGVTNLVFLYYFDDIIKGYIPDSVKYLTFVFSFNQSIKNCIPSSVTHLEFGDNFDCSINGSIPSSVIYLTFGYSFNRSIRGNIPFCVTHLIFGTLFNKRIKNSKDNTGRIIRAIPASVVYLEFGDSFNQPIKDYIPPSVTHIKFGYHFNQPINGLPSSVKKIELFRNYRKPIDVSILAQTEIIRI